MNGFNILYGDSYKIVASVVTYFNLHYCLFKQSIMETTTIRKLKLDKKTISLLNHYNFTANLRAFESERNCPEPSVKCTLPECGSVQANCRTDHYTSCAPCLPPKTEPQRTWTCV